MQHVLLKVKIYHLVLLDDVIHFKGFFITINKTLNINDNILAKHNHKGLLVEKLHYFINKNIIIIVEDRRTNDVFIVTSDAVECAYNSFPIDGTNILRNVLTIGRELPFSLYIDLSASSVISYLRLTDSNRYFSFIIL